MTRAPVRVLIAGYSPLVRSSIGRALAAEADMAPITVADWVGCREILSTEPPDVLITRTVLDDRPFQEVIKQVLELSVRVLLACHQPYVDQVPELLFAGASGFLVVDTCTAPDLVAAVRSIAVGGSALESSVAAAVLHQWRELREAQPATPAPRLTARELEVLAEMVQGTPTRLIGRILALSPKTVESHRSRIYAKLNARTHAQAVQIALATGLVPPAEG